MVARGEVATWVTVSDPWVSGVLQAVQLFAIGPQVWDIILEDLLPGGGALAAAHWISSLVAGYTALGMLDVVIIYMVTNMTKLQRFRRARTYFSRNFLNLRKEGTFIVGPKTEKLEFVNFLNSLNDHWRVLVVSSSEA